LQFEPRRAWTPLAAILAAATLLTLIVVNLTTLAGINSARPLILHTRAVQAVLVRIRASLVDAETGQRGFLLLEDPAYLEPLESAEKSLPDALVELRALAAGDPSQVGRIAELETLASAKMAEVRRTVDLFQRGEPGAALAIIRTNQGKSLMAGARRLIDALREEEDRRLEERTGAVRRRLEAAMWIDGCAGLGLILLGLILYAISRDIARREVLEAKLRESVAFQEQFVGILGHDLRNPLQAVSMGADLLLRYGGLPHDHSVTVGRIVASAARMHRMVDQLLDLTRARLAGGIPVEPKAGTDLAEVARGVVEELRVAHPDAELNLELAGRVSGEWDADRIAQVVSNLVANAIQHGAGTPVEVQVKNGGASAIVEVRNGGSPIPASVLPTIFDPFRSAQNATARAQGLGLGLYITREIVLAHCGSIDAVSSDRAGTTFRVTLPSSRG
jgi:signal transduction histidine kinase